MGWCLTVAPRFVKNPDIKAYHVCTHIGRAPIRNLTVKIPGIVVTEKANKDIILDLSFEARFEPADTLIAVGEGHNHLSFPNTLNPGFG